MSIAPLAPCPSCARHVRADSDRCPFCATSFHATTFEVVPEQGSQRLKRAAIFAFATTVASVGCTNPQRPDTGNNIVQPYGAPPDPRPRPQPQPQPEPDAGMQTPQPIPIVPPYGAPPDPTPPPPTDAGTRNEPPAVAAIYGAPPPIVPDAGTPRRQGGGRSPAPRYGAPPPPDDLH